MPILKTIAKDSADYRDQAIDLATRYALLKMLLGQVFTGTTKTISHAKDAVVLSKGTANISLQLSAYVKLAWSYLYDK